MYCKSKLLYTFVLYFKLLTALFCLKDFVTEVSICAF